MSSFVEQILFAFEDTPTDHSIRNCRLNWQQKWIPSDPHIAFLKQDSCKILPNNSSFASNNECRDLENKGK